MQPHPLPFRGGERARLVPDPVLDRNAADVVHERRSTQELAVRIVEPGVAARRLGHLRDRSRMSADPRRLEVPEVGEGGEHGVESGRLDGGHGRRLGRQRRRPLVSGVQLGPNLGADPLERVHDGRVVGVAAASAHPFARILAEHASEIGVPRDADDANGERNPVALETGGVALAVPALVGVAERLDDRGLQANRRASIVPTSQWVARERAPAFGSASPRTTSPARRSGGPPGATLLTCRRRSSAVDPITTGPIAAR